MTKAGKRLLQGAREALEFAKGDADTGRYLVHEATALEFDRIKESRVSEAITDDAARQDKATFRRDSSRRHRGQ